ncbi:MAG TPA: general secretion pathway protein GspE, partial [Planctomycetaceae bacterium]|nr:general secretion pathway protein GspE [Planctomycetaceae bacterium]
ADLPDDFPWDRMEKECGGQIYKPVGCRECRQVGYRGRSGIYELMVTSNAIRELTGKNSTAWEVKKAALAEGMRTLRMDGWEKVLSGKSSVDEIARVTKRDAV